MKMMDEFESDDAFGGDGISIAFRDVLIAAVCAVTALMMYLLVVANSQKTEPTMGELNEPAESLKIEVFWNHEDPLSVDKPYKYKLIDTDVDTGVQFRGGPEVPKQDAVWFTNMGAGFINLRRDDLGNRPNAEAKYDPVNYEFVDTRGIPAGEYCVNVHLYRNSSSLSKIPVTVNVRIVRGQPRKLLDGRSSAPASSDVPKLTKTVVLDRVWQESNVFCFTVNDKFEVEKPYSSPSICFHNASYQCR